jgi:hypothetical protein
VRTMGGRTPVERTPPVVIIAFAAGWLLASVGLALLIALLIGGAQQIGDRVEQRLRRRPARWGESPTPSPVHSGEPGRELTRAAR